MRVSIHSNVIAFPKQTANMAERPLTSTSPPPRAAPTLGLQALANELNSVENWYRLGVTLGLQGHQLREIERDYRGDNYRCKNEMLDLWLRNTSSPTWEAIARALDLMQEQVLADDIRSRYCSSSTPFGKYS